MSKCVPSVCSECYFLVQRTCMCHLHMVNTSFLFVMLQQKPTSESQGLVKIIRPYSEFFLCYQQTFSFLISSCVSLLEEAECILVKVLQTSLFITG